LRRIGIKIETVKSKIVREREILMDIITIQKKSKAGNQAFRGIRMLKRVVFHRAGMESLPKRPKEFIRITDEMIFIYLV
jgi:hypothetical protein